MFKRILVPLDGSRFSSRALRYAEEIAERFDADIILTRVVTPATPIPVTSGALPSLEGPSTAEMSMRIALEQDKRNQLRAKRYLSRRVRGMKSQGIKTSYYVIVGDPASSIMELANKQHVDLLVMTTHGKSGLKRAIMGSTADKVVRESGKPVLVIRPKTGNKK